ncbi:MAG: hypothetical protein U5R31_08795 [Acidimicrobiia bacterium]|nr:hypothetical protein [Acidimicrobiia bacterium]
MSIELIFGVFVPQGWKMEARRHRRSRRQVGEGRRDRGPGRDSEEEIVDGGTRSFVGEPFESWRDGNLVGTPEQVAEKVRT